MTKRNIAIIGPESEMKRKIIDYFLKRGLALENSLKVGDWSALYASSTGKIFEYTHISECVDKLFWMGISPVSHARRKFLDDELEKNAHVIVVTPNDAIVGLNENLTSWTPEQQKRYCFLFYTETEDIPHIWIEDSIEKIKDIPID